MSTFLFEYRPGKEGLHLVCAMSDGDYSDEEAELRALRAQGRPGAGNGKQVKRAAPAPEGWGTVSRYILNI